MPELTIEQRIRRVRRQARALRRTGVEDLVKLAADAEAALVDVLKAQGEIEIKLANLRAELQAEELKLRLDVEVKLAEVEAMVAAGPEPADEPAEA